MYFRAGTEHSPDPLLKPEKAVAFFKFADGRENHLDFIRLDENVHTHPILPGHAVSLHKNISCDGIVKYTVTYGVNWKQTILCECVMGMIFNDDGAIPY